MMANRILVIEDDDIVSFSLKIFLSENGYDVSTASDGITGYNLIKENHYPVILSDISLPGMTGKQILKNLKSNGANSELILFTGYGSIQDAVECMKRGAHDYFVKPVNNEELLISIRRAFEHVALRDENQGLKEQLDAMGHGEVVYRSKKMEVLLRQAKIAAETDATVLITGESGTGKTLLAKQIHSYSRRKSCPFLEVSCGALSEGLLESELFGHKKGAFSGAHSDKEGKFEASNGGTIFLDDINSSSLGFQIKLLRVIEERVFERVGENKTRTTDARIIAATNVDLMSLGKQGKFREDLFHRLNVIGLEMPSLKDRREDIPALIHFFIEKFSLRHQKRIGGTEERASEILLNYSWPGNVRELENVLERAVIFSQGNELKLSDLPDHIKNAGTTESSGFHCEDPQLCRVMEEHEKNHIARVLKMTGDNRSKAAELMNISRATLFNKMRKYGML